MRDEFASRPARSSVLVGLVFTAGAILFTEAFARLLLDGHSLSGLRRVLIGLVMTAGLVAAVWGFRAGVAAGLVGGFYAPVFFAAFGTAPALGDRVAFGACLGVFILVTSAGAGYFHDRTRRLSEQALEAERRRVQELAATNAALRDFSHVVAHDLRNPVRGIVTLAGDIEEEVGPRLDAAQRDDLALLRREAERLTLLLEGLLDYSRASRLEPEELQPLRVREALESEACQTRFASLVRERDARILPPSAEAPLVMASVPGLALILGNLVSNAIRHNPKPRPLVRVDVRPSAREGRVEVAVEDDGPGFDPQSLARWEAALAGHGTPRGLGRGGFGLLIVARAAERLDGEVLVGASPEGGASVRVVLQAAPPATGRRG